MQRKAIYKITFETTIPNNIKAQSQATAKIMKILSDGAPEFNFEYAECVPIYLHRVRRRFH